jgi:antitoxin (DNA-binding transcriptional repressor) of toxin-antitoxin stability system
MTRMPKMTAFEAKTRFGELLQRVERGEEIVITRHDRPIARVMREGAPNLDSVRRSVEGLRQLQQRIRKRSRGKATLSTADVRNAVGHGRK